MPDRDHVGSHVGSAHDLESRCVWFLGPVRDTNPRAQGLSLSRDPAMLLGDHSLARRLPAVWQLGSLGVVILQ